MSLKYIVLVILWVWVSATLFLSGTVQAAGIVLTEDLQVTGSGVSPGDHFGKVIAVSGDTMVVGTDSGAVYVFVYDDSTWVEQAQLLPSDPNPDSHFGQSVAIDGDTIVVGAPGDYGAVPPVPGAGYVFTRSGTSWTQEAKIVPDSAVVEEEFGFSVSVSGDVVLIGAHWQPGTGTNKASAYVFTRSGSSWTQDARLQPAPNPYDPTGNNGFGYSVVVSGNTAYIGAPNAYDGVGVRTGAVYVFTEGDEGWEEVAITPESGGSYGDRFGEAIAVSGDTLLVGAPAWNIYRGAAYTFTVSGATWTQEAMLTPSDAALIDGFGTSVALEGDTALIGAPNKR